MLANCRAKLLLDRLGRCLKLFVSTESTSSHELASQFGLDIFYTRKTPKKYHEYRVARATVHLNEPATPGSAVMVERHRPVGPTAMIGGDRLSQNGEKQQFKMRVYTFTPGGALRDKSHRCPRPVKTATMTVYSFIGLKSVV